jgi:regulator of protease activity HflC (stomatin/prohibitin superfamily)
LHTVLLLLIVLAVVVIALGLQFFWPRPRIVTEYERGLRFRKGRLVGEVGPGRYWLSPRVDALVKVDTRRRQMIVSGQEVLTSDRVPLKVSLVAEYSVADATRAVTQVETYQDALYGGLQLALREVLARKDLDEALGERGEIGSAILQAVAEQAGDFGVELRSVQVRDFMMAGGLRSAYSDVIQERQRGLAALERARGESAALRNLANAAELLERHPGLAHLRLLQAVEGSSGNRIVIALDPERGRKSALEVAVEGDA